MRVSELANELGKTSKERTEKFQGRGTAGIKADRQ